MIFCPSENSLFRKILAFGLLLPLFTCQNNGENNAETQLTDTLSTEQHMLQEESDFSFVPPSPLQIASIFKHSGLDYVSDVTNPVNNLAKYTSSLKKQLNFGVYSADLSYCVLNNQSKQALNYMNAVKQLSDHIGMSSIMNSQRLFDSFQANVGNEDSMISILATVQEGMDDYLQDSEQQYLSAIFFAGGWIEGMYIGSMLVNAQDEEIAKRLVEQMNILDGLIKGVEQNPHKSDELKKLLSGLKEIKQIYDHFSAIQGVDTESEDFSFEQLSITPDELKNLKEKIIEIRNWIVN